MNLIVQQETPRVGKFLGLFTDENKHIISPYDKRRTERLLNLVQDLIRFILLWEENQEGKNAFIQELSEPEQKDLVVELTEEKQKRVPRPYYFLDPRLQDLLTLFYLPN